MAGAKLHLTFGLVLLSDNLY